MVEVALGVTDLGLGMAGGVPGMIMADLGAEVIRVVDAAKAPIDADTALGRAWHRDKQVVVTGDPARVREILETADIALVYGSEEAVEGRGLGYDELRSARPELVYARCRPSRTQAGASLDFALLVEARAGFCTQLEAHRTGPMFVDVHASESGAAFLLSASALALLRHRALPARVAGRKPPCTTACWPPWAA